MNIPKAAYLLLVPAHRRDILLDESHFGYSWYGSTRTISEPIPKPKHGRRIPFPVFASFEDGLITHIARGRLGASAGTGLVRLNMNELQPIARPIKFDELMAGIDSRIRRHLKRYLAKGGIPPPKTLEEFVRRMFELDPAISDRLAGFLSKEPAAWSRLSSEAQFNLALQKESLALALKLADIQPDELAKWDLSEEPQQSFLEGLPGTYAREDTMLLRDFSMLPGFDAIDETTHYGTKVFESTRDPPTRVTIIMANRQPLEQQTGADLIYFNETYRSFTMVQYKAMERGHNGPEFRWRPGDQFTKEIERMEQFLALLGTIPSGTSPQGFRFSQNPFFLKFCSRVIFNPDQHDLVSGIYLPLELWKRLHHSGRLKGEKGGNVLTFANVGRRINNTEFINLVRGSWVGTSIEQSMVLANVIRQVLASGRTVTFAFRHAVS